MSSPPAASLFQFIVDRINVGILAVDREHRVVLWNHFMATHSGRPASEVVGRNLFESFPDIPATWLSKKLKSVFILKNYAFTSWQQRPYVFRLAHNRPITGGVDSMRQDCTFLPVFDAAGEVEMVCIVVVDTTDTALFEGQLRVALKTIETLSEQDALTGVFNRRKLQTLLDQEFVRSRRYGTPLSFLMCDIDFFKRVNDTFGHLAGDEVLKAVAAIARGKLRSCDSVARYGGEEFAVMLVNTPLDGAIIAAERLRASIGAEPIPFGDVLIPVTVSVGITELRTTTPNSTSLVQEADTALYASKRNGRNRVTTYPVADTGSRGD